MISIPVTLVLHLNDTKDKREDEVAKERKK